VLALARWRYHQAGCSTNRQPTNYEPSYHFKDPTAEARYRYGDAAAGAGVGVAVFFRGNYEDFIEDHTKRDGRDGLDPTLGISIPIPIVIVLFMVRGCT
jgi:hypothetical protein